MVASVLDASDVTVSISESARPLARVRSVLTALRNAVTVAGGLISKENLIEIKQRMAPPGTAGSASWSTGDTQKRSQPKVVCPFCEPNTHNCSSKQQTTHLTYQEETRPQRVAASSAARHKIQKSTPPRHAASSVANVLDSLYARETRRRYNDGKTSQTVPHRLLIITRTRLAV